jgi:C4-dicarboxylate-binding protein DctP
VRIVLYPSSQLYKASEVRSAVGSGTIEMGASLLSEYVSVIPAVDIFSLPFLFSQTNVGKGATLPGSPIRSLLEEAILIATNARVLWWMPLGFHALVSKGSVLTSPASIVKKRVRAPGGSLSQFLNLCGAIAVSASGSEQYNLLASGQVDASVTAIDSVSSRKMWEVADAVALTRDVQEVWVVIVNETVWRSLAPKQQLILQNAAREAERAGLEKLEAVEKQSIALAVAHGMKVADITPEDLDDWKSCSTQMSEDFLAKSGSMGQKVMDGYRKVLAETLRPSSR